MEASSSLRLMYLRFLATRHVDEGSYSSLPFHCFSVGCADSKEFDLLWILRVQRVVEAYTNCVIDSGL